MTKPRGLSPEELREIRRQAAFKGHRTRRMTATEKLYEYAQASLGVEATEAKPVMPLREDKDKLAGIPLPPDPTLEDYKAMGLVSFVAPDFGHPLTKQFQNGRFIHLHNNGLDWYLRPNELNEDVPRPFYEQYKNIMSDIQDLAFLRNNGYENHKGAAKGMWVQGGWGDNKNTWYYQPVAATFGLTEDGRYVTSRIISGPLTAKLLKTLVVEYVDGKIKATLLATNVRLRLGAKIMRLQTKVYRLRIAFRRLKRRG